jgi:protein-tyrosine-phosphatase
MSPDRPLRVLFLCTGNSARSQIAEVLLRHFARNRVDVLSAGSAPKREVHPLVKETLKAAFGINVPRLTPKSVGRFAGQHFDYVITLCDEAAEACPVFPGEPEQLHWNFQDPAAVNDENARRRAFALVASGIAGRIREWMALPSIKRRVDPDAAS